MFVCLYVCVCVCIYRCQRSDFPRWGRGWQVIQLDEVEEVSLFCPKSSCWMRCGGFGEDVGKGPKLG